MSQLENKHLLGGLTLRDLIKKIDGGHEVRINDIFYATSNVVDEERFELWETLERLYDNDPPDRAIDLDTPVKVRDGSIILIDPVTDTEDTMELGATEFKKINVEIP
jgi:hypothetical protein